jgi:hypothetical protein
MESFKGCFDWCRNHPALLITYILLLSVVLFSFAWAVYPTIRSLQCTQQDVNTDPEKQSQETLEHGSRYLWDRVWNNLSCSVDHGPSEPVSTEDFEEYQEKTPLLDCATFEARSQQDDHSRNMGQLTLNWHGSNHLNTSWSYMA